MDSASLDAFTTWINAHPIAAGLMIFLIAFGDSLVIVGIAVTAMPLLFAAGMLVGLGHINGSYALVSAMLGVFLGDGLSFWVGHRFGPQLRQSWPFSRYPQWLESGERTFRKHGVKSIVIARFVGAIRPFVPAIVGMLGMPLRRYLPASAFSAVLWSVCMIVPGWAFGTSLDLLSAVAGRLAIVLAVVLGLLALIWAGVYYLWRWAAPRTAKTLERALAWSHRHPVLGRYSGALIDPNRPESASLAMLAIALLFAGWAFFSVLIQASGGSAPSGLDWAVHHLLFGLRQPLADPIMAFLATLGDVQALAPGVIAVFAWLCWRQRRIAAWHWLAAPAFALGLAWALGYLLDMPRPPAATAAPGFGFPSASVTLATVVYGFFAVLIARALPGKRRVWPYVLAALLVGLLGFARLYLGAHWLSDVLAGIFLGLLWVAALGIAYRRRVLRAFWVLPTAAIFFGSTVLATGWFGLHNTASVLAEFQPPLIRTPLPQAQWWNAANSSLLPTRRNELRGRDAWPLNIQYAGDLDSLRARLLLSGWDTYQPGGWPALLKTLDRNAGPDNLAILPATHQGRAEALLMVRRSGDASVKRLLRLWPTRYYLVPNGEPLWIGVVQDVRFSSRFDFFCYWAAQPGDRSLLDELREDMQGLVEANEITTGSGQIILRLMARQP